jgi:hypothetical protein
VADRTPGWRCPGAADGSKFAGIGKQLGRAWRRLLDAEDKSRGFAAQHTQAAEPGAYGLEELPALPRTVFPPAADTIDGRGAVGRRDDRRRGDGRDAVGAEETVTALYHIHAAGRIRLAVVMLGDRAAAEDVVQDAFCALYPGLLRP